MWECERWRLYKTTTKVKLLVPKIFIYTRSLTEYHHLEEKKNGKMLGYDQCNTGVHEKLRANFANMSAIFVKILGCKNDTGDLLKNFAEAEDRCLNLGKCWYQRFTSQNAKVNPPLMLFLSATGAHLCGKTPFCSVHSKEGFAQLFTVSIGHKKPKWRVSKLQCSRR